MRFKGCATYVEVHLEQLATNSITLKIENELLYTDVPPMLLGDS